MQTIYNTDTDKHMTVDSGGTHIAYQLIFPDNIDVFDTYKMTISDTNPSEYVVDDDTFALILDDWIIPSILYMPAIIKHSNETDFVFDDILHILPYHIGANAQVSINYDLVEGEEHEQNR